MPEQVEHRSRVLSILVSLEFWLILAYVVLAIVVVWLYVVAGQRRRDEAIHRGEVISDARSKVNACILSRPQLRKTDAVLAAILDFHEAVYKNARQVVQATAKTDPTYRVRVANANRIARTLPPLRRIHYPVPTLQECLARGQTRYGLIAPTVPIKGGR